MSGRVFSALAFAVVTVAPIGAVQAQTESRTIKGQTVAFIGGLTGQRLWRVKLNGKKVTGKRAWYVGSVGRIRSTAVAHGDLYFTSSNTDGRAIPRRGDDKIFRVDLH